MARPYLHSDARRLRLERLVRETPGITVDELAQLTCLAYFSVSKYMRHLAREERVRVVSEAKQGCVVVKRFYAQQAT